ncbi:MAG: MBL fold metallo-hydrolase, partial [bacterium]|nr:MBL fold metallo-hydrolase [bacterium]
MGRRETIVRVSCVTLLACIFFVAASAGADMAITFLDVGEGDAIHIGLSSGEHLLIDTGNVITGHRVVRFLQEQGVTKLTALIITHPHPDHMGGVFTVLDRFPVERVYDNGQALPGIKGEDLFRWYDEAVRDRDDYGVLKAGERLRFGEATVDVLWPITPASVNWNHNSLVLRLSNGHQAVLLMGDAGETVEAQLLSSGIDLKTSVLKVGHHGYRDATGDLFLEQVSPRCAVISVNDKNLRGYPSAEVLDRLRGHKVETLLT